MLVYKLTSSYNTTLNGTKWGENVTHKTKGNKQKKLCESGYLHFYENPLLAVIMNPIHGNVQNPNLWEAKAGAKSFWNQTKVVVHN